MTKVMTKKMAQGPSMQLSARVLSGSSQGSALIHILVSVIYGRKNATFEHYRHPEPIR